MVGDAPNPFAESMVNPALPLTGAWERRRIMSMQEGVLDDEDDILDDELDLDEDMDLDDFGDDDFDLYGEDDEDFGEDDDEDFGEDDDEDFGEDDEEFGLSDRRRARLIGKRRKLVALWAAAAGRPSKRRRLRRRITKLSKKLGMPLPPQLQNVIETRQARRAARRGVAPTDRRIFKPGAFRKPSPLPGAPAAVAQPMSRPVASQFVAPGVVTAPTASVPSSRYIPASRAARRRAAVAQRTERLAPGVRRGPGGAVYTRQEPGQWTRVGPGGGVREITRQPGGGTLVERLGAEPRTVNNIGAALIAFPFQSLALVGVAAVGGAVAAPFFQDVWNKITGR
jgi:hypothetical protein